MERVYSFRGWEDGVFCSWEAGEEIGREGCVLFGFVVIVGEAVGVCFCVWYYVCYRRRCFR